MRRTTERCLGVLLLCCLWAAPQAMAEKADRSQPVHLEADSVRIDDAAKTAVYEGHVVLTQGTMTIRADRIDVKQDAQGMESGVALGRPVHFRQKLDGRDEYMKAEADRVEYNERTQILKLIGAAHIQQGQHDVHGAVAVYNMRTERHQALGADGGRIRALHLPAAVCQRAAPGGDHKRSLEEVEREYIREVLESTQGRKSEAARILGISRKTLLEKRKRFHLD